MTLRERVRRALPPRVKAMARAVLAAVQRDSVGSARRKVGAYRAARGGNPACLHLGCGSNVVDGWLNVDLIAARGDVIAYDLRRDLAFLADATIDFIYHEHFFEHLDRRSARRLLEECRRVLTPDGWMRIAMPDLDRIVRRYVDGVSEVDAHVAEHRQAMYGDQLLRTPGEVLDVALRGWGHQFLYGEKDIVRMLELNGFRNMRRVAYHESALDVFRSMETRPPERSALIVEAQK